MLVIFSAVGAFIFASSRAYHYPERDGSLVSAATNTSEIKRVRIIEDESEASKQKNKGRITSLYILIWL